MHMGLTICDSIHCLVGHVVVLSASTCNSRSKCIVLKYANISCCKSAAKVGQRLGFGLRLQLGVRARARAKTVIC